jgi:hypothetical protein
MRCFHKDGGFNPVAGGDGRKKQGYSGVSEAGLVSIPLPGVMGESYMAGSVFAVVTLRFNPVAGGDG